MSVIGQSYSINWNSDLPITVAAGGTYNLSLSFTPWVKGALPGQLAVTSNATDSGTLVIGLNGTGTDPASTPPALNSLTCATDVYTGSGVDDCLVTLSATASTGGFAVSLSSDSAAVTVPATMTVPIGAISASFTSIISPVSSSQTATLTASAGSVEKTHPLKLNESQSSTSSAVLSALSCTTATYAAAGTDNCTVTLSAAAPTSGFAVSLASNNAAVTVPGSITVPAGASSADFTGTVYSATTNQTATLTASAGGVSKTFALQLNAATAALAINSTSLPSGNVTVNTSVTQSIILSSTGTLPVTLSTVTITGTGFSISGTTLPLTLSSGQSATLNVQFKPTVPGAASGTLTFVSNSVTSPTMVVNLSGTGVASITYEVDLSWDSPASTVDPVSGYNVYRSPSGASAYQQINSSMVSQTSYVDLAVQAGQSYDYVVMSVDASGVTSVPSNTATAPIP